MERKGAQKPLTQEELIKDLQRKADVVQQKVKCLEQDSFHKPDTNLSFDQPGGGSYLSNHPNL